MDISYIDRGEALEVIIRGKLDIDQSENFENSLTEKVNETIQNIVGVNLAKIDYVDSSGLGALIKVLNAAKNNSKSMVLFGANPKIQNVFQLARLEKFFTFMTPVEFKSKYPSGEDAEMDSMLDNL